MESTPHPTYVYLMKFTDHNPLYKFGFTSNPGTVFNNVLFLYECNDGEVFVNALRSLLELERKISFFSGKQNNFYYFTSGMLESIICKIFYNCLKLVSKECKWLPQSHRRWCSKCSKVRNRAHFM